MARKKGLIAGIVWLVYEVLIPLVLAGFFINGTTLTLFILSYIPQVIHTVVGYIIVISVLITVLKKLKVMK